ncbi:OsmC family protein [Fictibacillus sp. WQ 8-8]|uniref:OsmC family protein n=1 Tax=unclassified Fictibacillus TaxID=2644029 RepID=UPI0007858720|nr:MULTISPECIES: OsmC family protein [unclassified Fictibacillus]MCQ6267439.1 OsmC family protein [Fictibacillus sp. WQ 8-8]UZJ78342.1 OsmC family protein [Fictibacillus sp. KU28468]
MEFKMKENGFQTQFEYGTLDISGNEEYGFRPYQLMVSSVAVCSGGVLRKVLDKMRIDVQDITIRTQVVRNRNEADRIESIHMHFIIKGQELSSEKIEKALRVTEKNCSMVQSVKGSIDITDSFELTA